MDEVGHEGGACGGEECGEHCEDQFADEKQENGGGDTLMLGSLRDLIVQRGTDGDRKEERARDRRRRRCRHEIGGDHDEAAGQAVGDDAGDGAKRGENRQQHHDVELRGFLRADFVPVRKLRGSRPGFFGVLEQLEHHKKMNAVAQSGRSHKPPRATRNYGS